MKKIAVGILGATGMVGQKFVELLTSHPWFEITALAASDRSIGKTYEEATRWAMPTPLPLSLKGMRLVPCSTPLPCSLVFSSLDPSIAGEIEENFARAGYLVISNSRNHRMHPSVPLLIPELNSQHLDLVKDQTFFPGAIITNPNCSVTGLSLVLKPLMDRWNIQNCHVVTMQALSGAGYPGIPSMDILDNVIPFISGEEDKIESEPLKIFGTYEDKKINVHPMKLSAQCTRVPVSDGHMACVSVKLEKKAERHEIIEAWNHFQAEPQHLNLPTAPTRPLIYLENETHPQSKLHRNQDKGMAVSIGRLRECSLFDWKFVIVSHNTVRGAAGSAILNAELMLKKGFIPL